MVFFCECFDRNCGRMIVLDEDEYSKLSAIGVVMHPDCNAYEATDVEIVRTADYVVRRPEQIA